MLGTANQRLVEALIFFIQSTIQSHRRRSHRRSYRRHGDRWLQFIQNGENIQTQGIRVCCERGGFLILFLFMCICVQVN